MNWAGFGGDVIGRNLCFLKGFEAFFIINFVVQRQCMGVKLSKMMENVTIPG